jgi:hypothetical protein
MEFIQQLKLRNETLYYFGLVCLGLAILFLILSKTTHTQVFNVSAWFKPFKFAFSTFLFAWTMGWYCAYLPSFNINLFNISVVVLLGFEIAYIALQASRGQLSHFNLSTPTYAAMYSLMAIAASAVALYTAYVGILFFTNSFPELPLAYVWAIRFGIVLFVVFSFEGFVMGSKLTHTIGGADGGEGLPILNWSTRYGDPRVAHFFGMHALQVLPLLAYYLFKDTRMVFVLFVLYALLAVFTLVQALQGKPFVRKSNPHNNAQTNPNP